jgi:ribonuclease Z
MQLTITGYSTALFSTWYFIEEWGICFDAGDGLISALLQKSRKIDHVFLSHADRDHLTGLLQFNQLNARPGYPIMHYPVDAGSFVALERFSKQFDTQVERTVWLPAKDGDEIAIAKDLLVLPARNGHVPVEQHIIKSLGYTVVQTRKKLKAEYAMLSGEELRQLGERIGRENLSHELRENLLAYSGDTPTAPNGMIRGSSSTRPRSWGMGRVLRRGHMETSTVRWMKSWRWCRRSGSAN